MNIRKLTTWQEWLESDRIISTAFLHKWDENKAAEEFRAQADGNKPRAEEAWGLFDDRGNMTSSIVTGNSRLTFDGSVVDVGDVHKVASQPESRGGGSIRAMLRAVLDDFRSRGCVFATLHPFSFPFYRKFGFELAERCLSQKAAISQFAGFKCEYSVRQVRSQEDADMLRDMYSDYISDKNFADVRSDKDWKYRGNGEYGEPNWWFGDNQNYTYIFTDKSGARRAYLKFCFTESPTERMIGTMEVREFVFDSPEAFRNVLGFIYSMRAKIADVNMELPLGVDLGLILPECEKVERKFGGHLMGRVLNVEKALYLMKHPEGSGNYAIGVKDDFINENSGVYAVAYKDGRTVSVEKTGAAPDMEVTIDTLCQMMLGITDLAAAEYRNGTVVTSNRALLSRVFTHKAVFSD